MINLDRLFEEENKEFLGRLEADSARLLEGLNNAGFSPTALDAIKTTKNFEERSRFHTSPFGPNWHRTIITPDPTILQDGQTQRNELIFATFFEKEGLKVLDRYESDPIKKSWGSFNDSAIDINIYYEYGSGNKLFAPLCYVAMNQNLLHYILPDARNDYQTPEYITKEILKGYKKYEGKEGNHPITYERLLEAIEYEVTVGASGLSIFYRLAMKLLQSIADGIRGMAPTRAQWDPKHPRYNPLISLELLATITNKWDAFKNKANAWATRIKEGAAWCEEKIPVLGPTLGALLGAVGTLLQNLLEAIDSIVDVLKYYTKIVRLVNAFVCGALAEILEMVAAIFDLIALLLSLSKDREGRDRLKKTIEALINKIKEKPSIIIDEIKKTFENLTERYSEDKGEYQIAYNRGADVVTVLLWVDLIVAVVKAIKNLPKIFNKLKAWVERVGKMREAKLAEILGKKKTFQEFLKKWEGKSILTLSKSEIVSALKGYTEQANRVAELIEKNKMVIKILKDDEFEKLLMKYGKTSKEARNFEAFCIDEKTFFRASSNADKLLSELVHEGTHALDNLAGTIGDVYQLEKRAFFHERAFQEATGIEKDFEKIEEMINFIYDNY